MQMNDFAKQAEINQFLMLHSMKSCNQNASNKAREDDSVFGGVWVSPEDDVKKNTLSLTGTEIWGPRPNQINEKSNSSDSSSIKSTPADITPEVISDKERFFFKNNNAIPYFQFPHGLNHSQNDQRMQQLFGDISHNYNQSNNVPPLQLHQQQQFRSDILPSGEDKFRSILDGKSSGSSSGRVSVSDQDSAIWGNYAQTLNDLNKKSNKNSSSDASQKDFSSPINYLADFPPTASIIQKDLLEKSFSSNMTTPWSTVVKQSIANNQEDWLNKMKINSNNNFPGSNPVAKMMSKDNLGPFHNSPWDQPSKPHLSQQSTNVWGLPLSQPTTINKHPGSNPTNIWGHSITKDLNIGSQCPVKFDPSVPPPPFPQKILPLNKNILDGKMPQMNNNNNTTNVNQDQLLSLLGRPLSSMSSSSMKQVGGLNNSREHQNSMQATYLQQQQQQQANNIFKHLNQQSFNMAATHQVTPMQRPSDLQWSELYKKLARHICSSAQLPQTRSRMIQFFTALGFKKETAGKLLIDNGLDFELTLGELIFKSAVSRGMIDTSLLSPGRSPLDPSKPINSNKHGGILQNYLISLHGIIQQMSFTQNCHDVSASAQPPIDYAIQALINSQERFTSPTLYMPNFSFTSNNYNNDQLVCGGAGGSSSLSSGVINNLKNLISSNNSASSSITGVSNDSSNVRSVLLSSSNNVKGNRDLNLGLGSNNNNRGMPPSFFTTPPHLGLSSPLPIFDVNCNNEQQQQQQQLLPLLHQQQQSKSSSMLNPRSPEWVPNSNSMLDSVGLVSGFGGNANSSIILSTSSATFVSSVVNTTGITPFHKQSNIVHNNNNNIQNERMSNTNLMAMLKNLKLNNDNQLATSNCSATFSLANSNTSFSIALMTSTAASSSTSVTLSGLAINEFIPGIPWKKDINNHNHQSVRGIKKGIDDTTNANMATTNTPLGDDDVFKIRQQSNFSGAIDNNYAKTSYVGSLNTVYTVTTTTTILTAATATDIPTSSRYQFSINDTENSSTTTTTGGAIDKVYHHNPLWIPPVVAMATSSHVICQKKNLLNSRLESNWTNQANDGCNKIGAKSMLTYFDAGYGSSANGEDGEKDSDCLVVEGDAVPYDGLNDVHQLINIGSDENVDGGGVVDDIIDNSTEAVRSNPIQSNWIVIKNISDNLKEESLTAMLLSYGSLKSVTFIKETNSVLVCYMDKQQAVLAKQGFDEFGRCQDAENYSSENSVNNNMNNNNNIMSAEFVPDWTTTLSNHHQISNILDEATDYGASERKKTDSLLSQTYTSIDMQGIGCTTPSGLWIPSKILENLDFYSGSIDNDGDCENDVEHVVGDADEMLDVARADNKESSQSVLSDDELLLGNQVAGWMDGDAGNGDGGDVEDNVGKKF